MFPSLSESDTLPSARRFTECNLSGTRQNMLLAIAREVVFAPVHVEPAASVIIIISDDEDKEIDWTTLMDDEE
jgi:hypothetical protein